MKTFEEMLKDPDIPEEMLNALPYQVTGSLFIGMDANPSIFGVAALAFDCLTDDGLVRYMRFLEGVSRIPVILEKPEGMDHSVIRQVAIFQRERAIQAIGMISTRVQAAFFHLEKKVLLDSPSMYRAGCFLGDYMEQ